jgi:hypothetical protein
MATLRGIAANTVLRRSEVEQLHDDLTPLSWR